jgi:hypothetical protein
MRTPYVWIALAVAALGPAANAADLTTMTRSPDAVVRGQPVSRPIVRLADQELGYSVLHDTGVSLRGYRVHLTCTLDGSFVQTFCPTTQYVATCPTAKIACR